MRIATKEELDATINQFEEAISQLPQCHMPVSHRFSPGIYFREIFMPKGAYVVGAQHKTEHFNVILTGRARVLLDGQVHEVHAGDVFVSGAGVRKVLHILEDMRWCTVHATHETDIEKLEQELIVVTSNYLAHKHEMKRLLEST